MNKTTRLVVNTNLTSLLIVSCIANQENGGRILAAKKMTAVKTTTTTKKKEKRKKKKKKMMEKTMTIPTLWKIEQDRERYDKYRFA